MLKNLFLAAAISWTFLIAFLCLVQLNNLPSVGISGIDKYVHFTFHFVFTLLWSIYFCLTQKKIELQFLIKVLLLSLVYGIVIELIQGTYTATRKADGFDVLANFFGAAVSVMVMISYKYLTRIKTKK